MIKFWMIKLVSKGRSNFVVPNSVFVCSNYSLDGRPINLHSGPALFLTISSNTVPTTPKKRNPPRKVSLWI